MVLVDAVVDDADLQTGPLVRQPVCHVAVTAVAFEVVVEAIA